MFEISSLPNGLQIVSSRMSGYSSVNINILVKIGSRYEAEHEHGICHFLEHMAFKGTTTRTYRDIAQQFDEIGGQFNAYTSREHTVYQAKVLSSDLEIAMDILADILQNSTFDLKEIVKEKDVILQEIAQLEDDPDDLSYDNLISCAFQDQPLGRSILGTAQTLATFDTSAFKNYIANHYHAKNMIIAAAGNVEHSKLMELSSKLFEKIPTGLTAQQNIATHTYSHKIITKDLEQANLVIGFPGFSYLEQSNFYKAKILSIILGGGGSSRLFQNIREKHGLAYSVGSFVNSYSDVGLFCLYGSTTADNLAKFAQLLQDETKQICDNISIQELVRAKKQIKANMMMAEEKSSNRCYDLSYNFAIFNKHIPTEEILAKIEEFSADDLSHIAQKIFSSPAIISLVGPKTKINPEEVSTGFKIL